MPTVITKELKSAQRNTIRFDELFPSSLVPNYSLTDVKLKIHVPDMEVNTSYIGFIPNFVHNAIQRITIVNPSNQHVAQSYSPFIADSALNDSKKFLQDLLDAGSSDERTTLKGKGRKFPAIDISKSVPLFTKDGSTISVPLEELQDYEMRVNTARPLRIVYKIVPGIDDNGDVSYSYQDVNEGDISSDDSQYTLSLDFYLEEREQNTKETETLYDQFIPLEQRIITEPTETKYKVMLVPKMKQLTVALSYNEALYPSNYSNGRGQNFLQTSYMLLPQRLFIQDDPFKNLTSREGKLYTAGTNNFSDYIKVIKYPRNPCCPSDVLRFTPKNSNCTFKAFLTVVSSLE